MMILIALFWFLSGSLTMAFLIRREVDRITANEVLVVLICGIYGLVVPFIAIAFWLEFKIRHACNK